jgi:hypothetical protein
MEMPQPSVRPGVEPGRTYDRVRQDLGNIVALEHVNVKVPDQQVATLFYVVAMGFTRDPYLMVGLENMWINIGQSQFHLPTGEAQNTRGIVGIVVPDLDALKARLAHVKGRLEHTQFSYAVDNGHVNVTCPWGNRMRCLSPGPEFGQTTLGIVWVEFPVPEGAADGIARFYAQGLGAVTCVVDEPAGRAARVCVGTNQQLVFRETQWPQMAYDGHHVQVYIADFSGPHRWLAKRGLVSEESSEHQYRFLDIVDPDSGQRLYQLEHEVRSVTHPLYMRPLVNRNAAQRQPTYQRGKDAFVPGLV